MDLHRIVSEIKKLARDLGKTPTILEMVASTEVSKRQINKHGWNELVKMAGLTPNSTHGSIDWKPEFREPKILILDIETAPLLVRTYGLWNQNISTGFIQKDWYILSFAAKWLDSDEIFYLDCRDTHEDDSKICELAWSLINEADVVVGHNSDRFDLKKLNTRFLKHDMQPMAKKMSVDTLKIAKKYFKITSNKLDYIAKFLNLEGKKLSKKYSQQEMWNGCCDGVRDCFIENEKYNIQDIIVTQNVYLKLAKWDESINYQSIMGEFKCICGSKDFKRDGNRYTKQGEFQRFRCAECGKAYVDKHNKISKEERKGFTK